MALRQDIEQVYAIAEKVRRLAEAVERDQGAPGSCTAPVANVGRDVGSDAEPS